MRFAFSPEAFCSDLIRPHIRDIAISESSVTCPGPTRCFPPPGIVIAMFICPPAAARLMTDRLGVQVAWSVVFALISATAGYVLAGYGPIWLGYENAVSAGWTRAADLAIQKLDILLEAEALRIHGFGFEVAPLSAGVRA